jgi:hypothetical protein
MSGPVTINLTGFSSYARLLPSDGSALAAADEAVAQLCLDAALDCAADAGIPADFIAAPSSKLALYVYALALHFYDNRAFMPSSQAFAVDEYTRRMMSKMRIELKYRPAPVVPAEPDVNEPETEGTDGA